MLINNRVMQVQPVFVLGIGGVGRALVRHILNARDLHSKRGKLRFSIVGMADSSGVFLHRPEILDDQLWILLNQKSQTGKLGIPLSPVAGFPDLLPPSCIVVDTTATDATVSTLLAAKNNGCGLVLANKLPLAGELSWYSSIADEYARWETTVGAALPVISTLNTLLDSGDEVSRIEGSLSGTLGYVASQLEQGIPFGDSVRDAARRGYTEPDPRQDLGGLDAARKALIMARMLGYPIGMSDIQIEPLYPDEMSSLTVSEFLREVDSLNQTMASRAAELMRDGRKLRYTAIVENGQCHVGLIGVDQSSRLSTIHASDSIVVFTTHYYRDNPLVVSGRGAGQEVTASGVLADLVSLSRVFA